MFLLKCLCTCVCGWVRMCVSVGVRCNSAQTILG